MPLSSLRKSQLYQSIAPVDGDGHPELERLKHLEFYIWDEQEHQRRYKECNGSCCFVDVIGRPRKGNVDMPLLPYQKLLWQMLHEHRKLVIRKSRGIGLSTYMLYVIAFKCLTEFQPGDRVAIISGVRELTVSDLIRRFKLLFLRNSPTIYSELSKQKDTLAIINGVIVEGYPVHSDSIRGIDKLKLAWIDESDMFPPAESKNIRSVIEGFWAKPNSEGLYAVWSSTPRVHNGLLWQLEHENTSMYYKMVLDYRWGLEPLCKPPIYDLKQITEARLSPDFSREYECQYSWGSNGVFDSRFIDRAIELGNKYPLTINKFARHSMGVDPGFGSSSCGICILEYSDGIIKVVYADQFERSSFNSMIHKIWELRNIVGDLSNIYIDGANTEFIEAVKQELGEDSNWHRIHDKIALCKKEGRNISDYMQTVPVSFAQEGASMLSHCKNLIENDDSLVAINSKYDKLIAGLKGSVAVEYKLTKSETPYCDLVDSFRLACKFFRMAK